MLERNTVDSFMMRQKEMKSKTYLNAETAPNANIWLTMFVVISTEELESSAQVVKVTLIIRPKVIINTKQNHGVNSKRIVPEFPTVLSNTQLRIFPNFQR